MCRKKDLRTVGCIAAKISDLRTLDKKLTFGGWTIFNEVSMRFNVYFRANTSPISMNSVKSIQKSKLEMTERFPGLKTYWDVVLVEGYILGESAGSSTGDKSENCFLHVFGWRLCFYTK